MELSVIIPTLNEAAHIHGLLQQLDSILPAAKCEVIVVDGGSTDETRQLVLAAKPTICLPLQLCQAEKGRAKQLNAGAKLAKGEYLYFLHADTQAPAVLYACIATLKSKKIPSACFQLQFDGTGRQPLLTLLAWFTRFDWNCFRFGDQSLLVRQDFFKRVGGYRNDFEIMEGNDLVRRLKQAGPFMLFPHQLVTSARKYRKNGAAYLQTVYVVLYLLARAGLGQVSLGKLYRRWVR